MQNETELVDHFNKNWRIDELNLQELAGYILRNDPVRTLQIMFQYEEG